MAKIIPKNDVFKNKHKMGFEKAYLLTNDITLKWMKGFLKEARLFSF